MNGAEISGDLIVNDDADIEGNLTVTGGATSTDPLRLSMGP
jgi:type V secretory pathway adhesin AidA